MSAENERQPETASANAVIAGNAVNEASISDDRSRRSRSILAFPLVPAR